MQKYTAIPAFSSPYFSSAQTSQSLDSLRHGMQNIKVILRPFATDSRVLVNSDNVAYVETRSSLVGLQGSE